MTQKFRCPHGHLFEVPNGFYYGELTFNPRMIAYCANCEHRKRYPLWYNPADGEDIICEAEMVKE